MFHNQFWTTRLIAEDISGIMFLGAPHFVIDQPEARETLSLMVRCHGRVTKRLLPISKRMKDETDNVQEIVEICKAFELLGLKVPVISASESKPTLIKAGIFSRFRSQNRRMVSAAFKPPLQMVITFRPDRAQASHAFGDARGLGGKQ